MAMIAKRRMWVSVVLGLLVAGALQYIQTRIPDLPKHNTVHQVASIMMMPGTVFTSLTRQIHDRSPLVIALLDFLFYTLCFYGLLTIMASRRERR
jgi:hypothetical protein